MENQGSACTVMEVREVENSRLKSSSR